MNKVNKLSIIIGVGILFVSGLFVFGSNNFYVIEKGLEIFNVEALPTPPSFPDLSSETPPTVPPCTATSPSRPNNLRAVSGPESDQVTLTWDASSPVTHYGINYGTEWVEGIGPNEYGIADIGNVTEYLVSGLTSGQIYYFVVYASNDCANSEYSEGVSAYAGTCEIICDGKCGGDDGCGGTCENDCGEGEFCNQESYACEARTYRDSLIIVSMPGIDEVNARVQNGEEISFSAQVKAWEYNSNYQEIFERNSLDNQIINDEVVFTNGYNGDKTLFSAYLPESATYGDIYYGRGIYMAIKGPKHLARYAVQTVFEETIDLSNSKILFMSGDLPYEENEGIYSLGTQDGKISFEDYRALTDSSLMNKSDDESLGIADINMDGVVNSLDKTFIFDSVLNMEDELFEDVWESGGFGYVDIIDLEKYNLTF